MHIPTPALLTALVLPVVLAAPLSTAEGVASVETRQARPPKPAPCVRMTPAPDANATKARFDAFAQAFIYKKNITEAFTYIAQDYIVSLFSTFLLFWLGGGEEEGECCGSGCWKERRW